MLYNLLGPGISFYRKSKINIKRKSNYEIGWLNKSLNLTLYCICCKIKKFLILRTGKVKKQIKKRKKTLNFKFVIFLSFNHICTSDVKKC